MTGTLTIPVVSLVFFFYDFLEVSLTTLVTINSKGICYSTDKLVLSYKLYNINGNAELL